MESLSKGRQVILALLGRTFRMVIASMGHEQKTPKEK
jgi:hypothetical protein